MDQRAIGGFIANLRKEKHLTQAQLAQLLGVTDKSVSKWENGLCLPDAAKYEPLCGILGISINELFAAKRIPDSQFRQQADRNLLMLLEQKMYLHSPGGISFERFRAALLEISEMVELLSRFETRAEAVCFLQAETGASLEECANAYDFYMKVFVPYEKMD